jgi:uracil-DNA glycosylase
MSLSWKSSIAIWPATSCSYRSRSKHPITADADDNFREWFYEAQLEIPHDEAVVFLVPPIGCPLRAFHGAL